MMVKGQNSKKKKRMPQESSLQKEEQKSTHQITDGKEGRLSQAWLIKLATPNKNIL